MEWVMKVEGEVFPSRERASRKGKFMGHLLHYLDVSVFFCFLTMMKWGTKFEGEAFSAKECWPRKGEFMGYFWLYFDMSASESVDYLDVRASESVCVCLCQGLCLFLFFFVMWI